MKVRNAVRGLAAGTALAGGQSLMTNKAQSHESASKTKEGVGALIASSPVTDYVDKHGTR